MTKYPLLWWYFWNRSTLTFFFPGEFWSTAWAPGIHEAWTHTSIDCSCWSFKAFGSKVAVNIGARNVKNAHHVNLNMWLVSWRRSYNLIQVKLGTKNFVFAALWVMENSTSVSPKCWAFRLRKCHRFDIQGRKVSRYLGKVPWEILCAIVILFEQICTYLNILKCEIFMIIITIWVIQIPEILQIQLCLERVKSNPAASQRACILILVLGPNRCQTVSCGATRATYRTQTLVVIIKKIKQT